MASSHLPEPGTRAREGGVFANPVGAPGAAVPRAGSNARLPGASPAPQRASGRGSEGGIFHSPGGIPAASPGRLPYVEPTSHDGIARLVVEARPGP